MSKIRLIDISPKTQGTPVVEGEVQSSRRNCMIMLTILRQEAQRLIPELRWGYEAQERLKKQKSQKNFFFEAVNVDIPIAMLELARKILGSKLVETLFEADKLLSVEEFCQACDLDIDRVQEGMDEWAPWNGLGTRYLWLIDYWGIEVEEDCFERGVMAECISAVMTERES